MRFDPPYLNRLSGLIQGIAPGGFVLDIGRDAGRQRSKLPPRSISVEVVGHELGHGTFDLAKLLNGTKPSLIVVREAWAEVLTGALVGQINSIVDQEIPLIVIEEVADPFKNYPGLTRRFETQATPLNRPLIFSRDIDDGLRANGFTPQSIELYRVNQSYRWDEWVNAAETSSMRRSLEEVPEFIMGDIGIQRVDDELSFPHEWTLAIAFKSDAARHRVATVASALLRRRINGQAHLLIQKRHREKDFWESWELPQGHIAPGEELDAAAERELFEETGLKGKLVVPQPLIARWATEKTVSATCTYTRIDQIPKKEFFSVGVLFDYVDGDPQSPEDREFTWAPVGKLQELLDRKQIFPLNEGMVRSFVEWTGSKL